MMKNVDVSVIMPIYNGKTYLRQSMDCVVGQKLNNIEIICVDDGSTDGSGEVLEEYKNKDSRIQVIHQENQGAGAARNAGLEMAQGNYVIFWDGDDLFDPKALMLMHRKLQKTGADLCVCGATQFDEYYSRQEVNGFLDQKRLPKKDPFNKYDIPEAIFNFAGNVVWNKLYSKEFLLAHDLKFQDIPQANDTAFVMLSMFYAEKITYVRERLIAYRTNNPESLTGRAKDTKFCLYESYRYAYEQLKDEKGFSLVRKSFQNKALEGMYRSLNILCDFSDYKEIYEFLKKEGFSYFGIQELREADYLKKWMYDDYVIFMSNGAEQFLLTKAKSRLVERDHLKFILNRVRRRLAFFFKVSQWLK